MSLHGHKHITDLRQTNGRDQPSMSLHRHRHLIDQSQTNGHNLQLIRLEQGHDLFVSHSNQSGVFISTNVFEVYLLQVKLIDVITIPTCTSLSLSHD